MVNQEKIRMTAEEFFQLPETTQPTELIDGELIVSPSPVPKHQIISGNLFYLLRGIIPNGILFSAPMDVYFDEHNTPQPDIIWVAANSPCVIGEKRLEGPPDLLVEIFSPGTARRDKQDKYQLYQRYGVREYWMVDTEQQYVEVHTHNGTRYELLGVYGEGESFASPALGKPVELKGIFRP
jgi:Uma2 family endonuclease